MTASLLEIINEELSSRSSLIQKARKGKIISYDEYKPIIKDRQVIKNLQTSQNLAKEHMLTWENGNASAFMHYLSCVLIANKLDLGSEVSRILAYHDILEDVLSEARQIDNYFKNNTEQLQRIPLDLKQSLLKITNFYTPLITELKSKKVSRSTNYTTSLDEIQVYSRELKEKITNLHTITDPSVINSWEDFKIEVYKLYLTNQIYAEDKKSKEYNLNVIKAKIVDMYHLTLTVNTLPEIKQIRRQKKNIQHVNLAMEKGIHTQDKIIGELLHYFIELHHKVFDTDELQQHYSTLNNAA